MDRAAWWATAHGIAEESFKKITEGVLKDEWNFINKTPSVLENSRQCENIDTIHDFGQE